MNTRSRWLNALIILLVIIAAIYLAQFLWTFLSGFADIILLFALAWLVSFMLNPMIAFLHDKSLPEFIVNALGRVSGEKISARAKAFHFSRAAAVGIIYLAIAVSFIIVIALLIAPVADEVRLLINESPQLLQRVPELTGMAERALSRFGVNIKVEGLLQPALNSVQGLASPLLQNILNVASGLVTIVGNFLFILVLSFFFALDRSKILGGMTGLIPKEYLEEFSYLLESVDRTFGGFIRAQLFQGLLMGVGTAIAMTFLGMDFALVIGIFSGLSMIIPLLGPFLAILPPLAVALLIGSPAWWILLLILIVLIVLLQNVLVPKLLSDALGLHPLVIFGALLAGIKVAGFWGALFAIPVAGVLVAMGIYSYERWQRRAALNAMNAPELPNSTAAESGQSSIQAPPITPPD